MIIIWSTQADKIYMDHSHNAEVLTTWCIMWLRSLYVNLISLQMPWHHRIIILLQVSCYYALWVLHRGTPPGGGTPYVMGDTYVPRIWPPFFTLAGSSTIFLGYFSHPPTAKLSFGVQKLPIFTKIDLFGPKFNFFLDLFGSNFQRPAAHPHQFSGRVPPPGVHPIRHNLMAIATEALATCGSQAIKSNLLHDWYDIRTICILS